MESDDYADNGKPDKTSQQFFSPLDFNKKFVQPCVILKTKWISMMLGNPAKILPWILHMQSSERELNKKKSRHDTALAEFCAECEILYIAACWTASNLTGFYVWM